ncbi:glutathione S-transferase family protein [Neorhizobium galegae]|uniref:Glutathione S-transferase family protein n=1 Tax=Neorhizobium galegae TaxID=399 RepID=A0A6A1TJX3_NEOGA|nr:glutathione S-transferase family protein [Neorhizobium galegae]KAB1083692.1 glutathione S-transferase family protein [Neorhizobium galegae]
MTRERQSTASAVSRAGPLSRRPAGPPHGWIDHRNIEWCNRGELDSPAYSRVSTFRQVPVIDDDGIIVAESGAVVLYLAEKAGKLIPADFTGRMEVVQWCFAAVTTVEPPLSGIDGIDAGMDGVGAAERRSCRRDSCCRSWRRC